MNVNALAPGYIKTDLNRHVWGDPERASAVLGRIPAGRWGEPADLAGAAVFLASRASDYLHGVVLPVDGGYLGARTPCGADRGVCGRRARRRAHDGRAATRVGSRPSAKAADDERREQQETGLGRSGMLEDEANRSARARPPPSGRLDDDQLASMIGEHIALSQDAVRTQLCTPARTSERYPRAGSLGA